MEQDPPEVLHGRTDMGSTVLNVVASYAEKLQEANCRLMLASVGQHNLDEFEKTGLIKIVNWRKS